MLHFLGKPGELLGLYDHVLYTLFPKINVNPVFLRFELNSINNSLNEICSYLLHHTKHYTLNLLTVSIVGERELSGISDTACYPFIPP